MGWISGTYVWPLPEANSTNVRDFWRHRLWAAWPCLSLSAVVFSRSIVVEFVHWTWICFSTCANLNIHSFNLNFRYMATSKQTYTRTSQCSHASVGLTQARPNNGILPYLQFPFQCYQLHNHNQWHWCTVLKSHAPLHLHQSPSREHQATGLHQHHVGYWREFQSLLCLCWLGSCPMSLLDVW